jgi:queuine tRNA-ribosyltransferase
MAFDDLTGLSPEARGRTEEAVERTHRWLVRCVAEFKKLTKGIPEAKRPLLFGICQGGLDKRMRAASLKFVQSQEVDGVAVGGLSVGESRKDMHAMLKYLATYAFNSGIDMLDCVMPTRNGRHGTVWSGNKRLNLTNSAFAADKKVIEQNCDCYTCSHGYSRALLRHLFKSDDPLGGTLCSLHNIRYLQRICERYQQ